MRDAVGPRLSPRPAAPTFRTSLRSRLPEVASVALWSVESDTCCSVDRGFAAFSGWPGGREHTVRVCVRLRNGPTRVTREARSDIGPPDEFDVQTVVVYALTTPGG